jgi:hypothetical protein
MISHNLGAPRSQPRETFRDTLTAGGGWTLIPTQGGDVAEMGSGWS